MSDVRWTASNRMKVAHVAPSTADQTGDFPLLCGQWMPNSFDAGYIDMNSYKPHCRRCMKKLTQREGGAN